MKITDDCLDAAGGQGSRAIIVTVDERTNGVSSLLQFTRNEAARSPMSTSRTKYKKGFFVDHCPPIIVVENIFISIY